MGGDYTQREWIQIGLFLLGLPAAALIGALIGLAGKWKQGFIVSAAVWGGAGAAVMALVVSVVNFLSVHFNYPASGISRIQYFHEYVSIWNMYGVLASAAITSLGAAIRFRLRSAQLAQSSPAATFTLRQLVLVQLFALFVLGCWTGMRYFAYARATNREIAEYKWARRGWKIEGNAANGKVTMERTYEPASADWKRESEMLLQVCKEPWLGELRLFQLDNADALDFDAIANAKNLEILSLRRHPMTMMPQSHIDAISKLSSLRELDIIGGDYLLADLTPLLKVKSLQKVQLWYVNCDEGMLREQIRQMKLAHFALYPMPHNKYPTVACWSGYFALHRHRQPIDSADLLWVEPEWITRLQIDGSELTLEAAQKISQMPNVDHVDLNCRVEGPALAEIAKCARLRHAFIIEFDPPRDRAAFDSALEELLMAPKLQVIDWNWSVMKPELDYATLSEEQQSMIRLGLQPLPTFNRPATTEQSAYVDEINRKRAERKLGKLTINPNDQMRQQLLSVPVEAP